MTRFILPLITRRRAGIEEASHFGAFCVMDSHGRMHAGSNADRCFLPRSAIKLIHALPFLETGAADRFSDAEIALAASSHLSEPAQLDYLSRWIAALALDPSQIICGIDAPLNRTVRPREVSQTPSVLTNNNLGKHLAVLSTILHCGEPVSGYFDPLHPAMIRLHDAVEQLCGEHPETTVLDNCGLPTAPIRLESLALGMARLADPSRLTARTGQAATRLLDAIARNPSLFGGARALVGQIVQITRGRLIAKGGSEGIFAALDRERKIGFALKVLDGSAQAASAALIALLHRAGSLKDNEAGALYEQTAYWRHRFSPDRSPIVEFPLIDTALKQ